MPKEKIKMPDKLQGNVEEIEEYIAELCFYSPCKIQCEECAFNSLENFNEFIKQCEL